MKTEHKQLTWETIKEVGEEWRLGKKAIEKWRERQSIPHKWRLPLIRHFNERFGKQLPLDVLDTFPPD